MFLSLLACWNYAPLRARPPVLWLVCASLLVRYAICFCEAFLFRMVASIEDADGIHLEAADPTLTAKLPYTQMLRLVYEAFGVSKLLGETLSVVIFLTAIFFFIELIRLLKQERHFLGLVALYALLPSLVIHTSLTLREAAQCLTFMAGLVGAFLLGERRLAVAIPLTGAALMGMALLHNGLALYAILFAVLSITWVSARAKEHGVLILLVCLVAGPLLAPRLANRLSEKSKVMRQVLSGNVIAYAEKYRTGVENARSSYGIELNAGSLSGLVTTLPAILFMYMFAPLPWQIRGFLDIYAFAEAVLRMALCWGAWVNIKEASPDLRGRLVFVLGVSLLLEFLWATGTTNWGTAIRHHSMAYGGLLLVGGGPLLSIEIDPLKRSLLRRRKRRQAQAAFG
ncbi:MAG: hypothetical protein KIS61_08095 [Candidatus Eremiobacteraeota bacterium]|nr:hypothetical protein [Candidatus Eremiobacteraeota bacterium]